MHIRRLLIGTTSLVALGLALSWPGSAFATDWTGAISNDWFNGGNWSTGVPNGATDATIDTTVPNETVVGAPGAQASHLTIGNSGTGTLTIQNGGAVSNGLGYIGYVAGSTGTATVDGAGSSWTNSVDLFVGYSGTGTLKIQNGGVVSNGLGYIGYVAGSTGTTTVDGAGSSWTNSSSLFVGFSGAGTLTIQNGGKVSNFVGSIGVSAGGTGTATVDGAGSSWANSGDLFVGDMGTGTLTIRNGGAVSNGSGYVGDGAGSTGAATVDGAGSSWANSGDLYVGNSGDGTLNIQNGGKVTNATGFVAYGSGSTGTVTVDGAGSSWIITDNIANPGVLIVGYSGAGTLTIRNGGAVSAAAILIAPFAGSSTGTLNIGAGLGQTAAAPGTLNTPTVVLGNGAAGPGQIVFNHTASNYAFDPAISGGGAVTVAAGTTILTAASTYTGPTTLYGGKLVVNGSIASSLVTVNSGTLGGNGTVGGLLVKAGGAAAPGNSIGTLNVANNVTFDAGSIYQVEVDAAGQSDKIVAAGMAMINGGTVQVLAGTGNFAPATTYTILTAGGGLTTGSAFSGVTSNLAFLDPSLSYDASNVYLTMTRNDIDFAGVGLTPNQIAIGGGAQSLGSGNAIFDSVLNLSADEARSAFDQLSGEVHASAKTALLEDSQFIRDAATSRIRSAFEAVGASQAPVLAYADSAQGGAAGALASLDPGATAAIAVPATTDRFALWGQGFGGWGNTGSDGNAARLSNSTGGFLVGGDAPVFDTWRLGMMAGYSRTDFNAKDRSSAGSSDSYHLGLYGGTSWNVLGGSLGLRTGASYTWHDISTSRSVAFPGFSDSLKGDYRAGTTQVFGELGYGIRAGSVSFEPFANLAYVNLHTDAFTEQGGAAALQSAATSTGVTFTTLGLHASTDLALGETATTLRGMLGWRHAFGDTTPLSTLAFAGGSPFTIAGVPIARDAAVLEAGLDLNLTPAATLGVSYGGQFGSGLSDQSVRADFNWKF